MKPFEYVAPRTLREALRILTQGDGQVKALAGGTDLLDQVKVERKTPEVIMDLKRIPELSALSWGPRRGLRIGAATPCARIYEEKAVCEHYPALAEACALVGSVQIQNRASVGGNICNAAPSADTIPPLLVYEARAVVAGPGRRRVLPLGEFFRGPGSTVLAPDEILVELRLPLPPPRSASHYLRFIPREEMDIAVAGVASLVALNARGRCSRVRIALAAVAPTPVRAHQAEALLEGKAPSSSLLQAVGEAAALATRPITDVRGSGEYRKELVKVLTRRTLAGCFQRLGVSVP